MNESDLMPEGRPDDPSTGEGHVSVDASPAGQQPSDGNAEQQGQSGPADNAASPAESASGTADPSELLESVAAYLPAFVIDRIAAAAKVPLAARSDQFPAAILFADVAGFTKLTETLAALPDGAEALRNRLSDYFGHLIDTIVFHGGDIVKFAGDALLAIWKSDNAGPGLVNATLRAAQCGLAIQESLVHASATENSSEQLELKINIAAGDLRTLEVGGIYGRWDWTICGQPLVDIAHGTMATAGQVILSKSAFQFIESHCTSKQLGSGDALLRKIRDPVAPSALRRLAIPPEFEPLLRSYVPRAVLDKLAAGQSKWLSELRLVTTIFVNLPSINHDTSLTDAQAAVEDLQKLIYRFEGSVNKLSVDEKGTTLVGAFGLPPLTHDDDPVRAILSAIEIHARFDAQGLAHSVGVASGHVFCGSLGNDTRREYTVLGDTVNLSARLMQAARGGILTDEYTRNRSTGRIEFDELEPRAMKGKREPVRVFRPLERVAPAQETSMAMIGRADCCERIATIQSDVLSTRSSRVAVLSGDKGIGKSRLFEHVLQSADKAGFQVFTGRADSTEKATPYYALRSVFRQLLAITADHIDSPDVERHVSDQLAFDAALQPLAPLLSVVLPVGIQQNAITRQMSGEVRADNTRELMVQILCHAASEQPLLIGLEDVHWLDSASWSVVASVVRSGSGVLQCLTARPDEVQRQATYQELIAFEQTDVISLGELSQDEMHGLVCGSLGVHRLSPAIARWLFDRSQGHPFYARELAFSLRDSEFVRMQNDTLELAADATDLAKIDFPDTLEGVVISRLDRLPPQQNMVVKSASVIGLSFRVSLLRDIHPIDVDRRFIPQYLASLEQRNLTISESGPGEARYAFQHAITRDVAYRLLLFADRQRLHQDIAEWYERTDDPSTIAGQHAVAGHYPRLAYHWAQAKVADKAQRYAEDAGELALNNGAYREAAALLTDSIRWATDHEASQADSLTKARLERMLGAALLGLGQLAESRSHLQEALRHLNLPARQSTAGRAGSIAKNVVYQLVRRLRLLPNRATADPKRYQEAARACALLSEVHYFGNDAVGFTNACLRMLTFAQGLGPSRELALAYSLNCLTAGTVPMPRVAESCLHRARTIVDSLDDSSTMVLVLLLASVHHVGHGQWPAAREAITTALTECERLNDHRNHGMLTVVLGAANYFTGQFEEGRRIWAELLVRGDQRGHLLHKAWGYGGQALNLLRLGRFEATVEAANHAIDLFKSKADLISEITTSGVRTSALLRLERFEDARISANHTTTLLQRLTVPTSYYLFEGYACAAEFYVTVCNRDVTGRSPVRDDLRRARKSLKSLAKYARSFPIGKPRWHYWKGCHEHQRGRSIKAIYHWHQSLSLSERLGMPYESALAHRALGRHGTLDFTKRSEHLATARRLFDQVGAVAEREESNARPE